MAVKERKQITGTTAQINAYEGHEGQIVWDKEKKTLVGMSGTAGTNYPLATQKYVDNRVSHLEDKVDTANAATTEALNKKENAGVCLPLTGGEVLGDIHYRVQTGEFSIKSSTRGARLALNAATRDDFNGQVILQADDGATQAFCSLFPNGDLKVNGGLVERSNEIFGAAIEGGFYEVYIYATGLQIIIAGVTIPANQLSLTFTFPRPFISQSYSIAANAYTEDADVVVTWAFDTTTNIKLYRKLYNGSYHLPSYIRCAFIGRWK